MATPNLFVNQTTVVDQTSGPATVLGGVAVSMSIVTIGVLAYKYFSKQFAPDASGNRPSVSQVMGNLFGLVKKETEVAVKEQIVNFVKDHIINAIKDPESAVKSAKESLNNVIQSVAAAVADASADATATATASVFLNVELPNQVAEVVPEVTSIQINKENLELQSNTVIEATSEVKDSNP